MCKIEKSPNGKAVEHYKATPKKRFRDILAIYYPHTTTRKLSLIWCKPSNHPSQL